MREITVQELAEALQNNPCFTLVDVREDYEYDLGHLECKCIHIPMGEIENRIHELDNRKETIIMCKSGSRAAAVANFMHVNYDFEDIGFIIGGVEAYANEIDNSIEVI